MRLRSLRTAKPGPKASPDDDSKHTPPDLPSRMQNAFLPRHGDMKPRANLSGMFLAEQRIMDLWDCGYSMERIAAAVPQSEDYVNTVVSRFASAESREFENMVRHGSIRLLAALKRAFPEIGGRS
jgi:hypothetical protein